VRACTTRNSGEEVFVNSELERFRRNLYLYAEAVVQSYTPKALRDNWDDLKNLLDTGGEVKLFAKKNDEETATEVLTNLTRYRVLGDRAAMLTYVTRYLVACGIPTELLPHIKV
jgi:hypothetical protein